MIGRMPPIPSAGAPSAGGSWGFPHHPHIGGGMGVSGVPGGLGPWRPPLIRFPARSFNGKVYLHECMNV